MTIKENGLYHWNNTYNNVVFKAKKEMSDGKPMSVSRLQSIYDNETIAWNSVLEAPGAWLDRLDNAELADKLKACVADFKFTSQGVHSPDRKSYLILEAAVLLASVIVGAVGTLIAGIIVFILGSIFTLGKIAGAADSAQKGIYEACFLQLKGYTSKIEAVLSEYDE